MTFFSIFGGHLSAHILYRHSNVYTHCSALQVGAPLYRFANASYTVMRDSEIHTYYMITFLVYWLRQTFV
jgi:hypothetical protein